MVTIRSATQHDALHLLQLIKALASHHHQESALVLSESTLADGLAHNPPRFSALLAEVNCVPAGYLSYTIGYSIWLGKSYMHIDDVFVLDAYRGKKIGEALMFKAQEVCKAQQLQRIKWEVEKNNEAAIRFYQRLGATMYEKGIFKWDF